MPMELGAAVTFRGSYHVCGQYGHKGVQCPKGKVPAAHTATNQHTSSRGKQQGKSNNLQ